MERLETEQAVERVKQMERCFDLLQKTADTDPEAFGRDPLVKEQLHILTEYYDNGQWLHDYKLDEQGLLPRDLKRGVLSQDGVYNLLAQIAQPQATDPDNSAAFKEDAPMFRKMAKSHKQIPQEDCIKILTEQPRGVLSLLGDNDYPYGLPLNHFYCPEDGKLYFHSAKFGHMVDSFKKQEKASFCTYDQGWREPGDWALNIQSVIVFGRIEVIEDEQKRMEIARRLCYKFTTDEAFIEKSIREEMAATLMFALVPEHITGKRIKEA